MHSNVWIIVLHVFMLLGVSLALLTHILMSESKRFAELYSEATYSSMNQGQVVSLVRSAGYEPTTIDANSGRWNSRSSVSSTVAELETKIDADLAEMFMLFTVQVLIWKGFTLGQDFSAGGSGTLLVSKSAAKTLMQCISAQDHLLLQEILQICD